MKISQISILCLILAVIGATQAVTTEEKEYLALFIEGKKSGHAVRSRTMSDGKVITTEEVVMTMKRVDFPVTVNTIETCIETTDGRPLGFEAVQKLSMMTTKITGKINKDGTINTTISAMGSDQHNTIPWPPAAVMAEGLRLLLIKNGLKEGTSFPVKLFLPSTLQATNSTINIGPKQDFDLLGRIVDLRKVTTELNMPDGSKITTVSFIDENLRTLKSITPVMGMQIEMISCTEAYALSSNEPMELIHQMFLKSPVSLKDLESVQSIKYTLNPQSGTENLQIPANDNQQVIRENGKIIVTVSPVNTPEGAVFPYKGQDKAILDATKPTRFLQSDRQEIINLARHAVGKTRDAAEAAKKIEAFVAGYIENRNFSVGYASAAEVAKSRQGDCSEFAVLTAAMCRAVGIPAEVVMGIAYVENFTGGMEECFGGHAWNQIYIKDKWIGLDAAFKSTGRKGFGPGHIALASGNGNPEELFNIAATLGRFEIEDIKVNK
jgi:hypothetical protein